MNSSSGVSIVRPLEKVTAASPDIAGLRCTGLGPIGKRLLRSTTVGMVGGEAPTEPPG